MHSNIFPQCFLESQAVATPVVGQPGVWAGTGEEEANIHKDTGDLSVCRASTYTSHNTLAVCPKSKTNLFCAIHLCLVFHS